MERFLLPDCFPHKFFLFCRAFIALNGPWGLQHLYLKVSVEEKKERR
jgi:hypothetical protein